MFDLATLQELAPTAVEQRELNVEAWLAEGRALAVARSANTLDIGRWARQARGRKDYRALVMRTGLSFLQVEDAIVKANREDGIVVPERKPREKRSLDRADAKEMLAMLEAGEVDTVVDTLKEYLRG